MVHIQIIIGSTRPGRLGKPISDWFINKAQGSTEASFETVDLADLNLPLLDEPLPAGAKKYTKEHTKRWSDIASKADAYIFVTPEYNHGTSAALKNALDYLHHEWKYKPVSFLGYGGFGGTRAIEQLIGNCVELNMFPLRESVHVNEPWAAISQSGEVDERFVKGSVEASIKSLVAVAEATKSLRN